jgi:hypothetical protein
MQLCTYFILLTNHTLRKLVVLLLLHLRSFVRQNPPRTADKAAEGRQPSAGARSQSGRRHQVYPVSTANF